MTVLCINISLGLISCDSCTRKFRDEFQIGGVYVTGYRYMIHFYCLVVEAGFYSDVVECLPVDPATWVRFPAGTGKIFLLYDNNLEGALSRIFSPFLSVVCTQHLSLAFCILRVDPKKNHSFESMNMFRKTKISVFDLK